MTTTTTPAFQQALLEVKKIKELATEEAKRALIEELTPAIKKEIERGIQVGALLFEEDDMGGMNLDSTPLPGGDNLAGATPPPTDGLASPGMETGMDLPAPASTGPVQPLGAGISGVPMPDQDGKVVVNLSQLWNSAPVGIPAAPVVLPPTDPSMAAPPMPAPSGPTEPTTAVPPVPDPSMDQQEQTQQPPLPEDQQQQPPLSMPESVQEFSNGLRVLEQRVKGIKENKTAVKPLHFEAAQTLVLELFDNLQELKETRMVPKAFIKEKEEKLASLFSSIKETQKTQSSYSQKDDTKVQEDMKKDLGAFARALFLEEAEAAKGSSGFGDKKGSGKGSHEGFGDGAKGGKGSAGFGDSSEKPKEKVGEKSKASEEAAGTHAKKASESRPVADPGKKESLKVEALTESEELEMEAIEAELKELFGEMDDTSEDDGSGDTDMMEVKKESLQIRLKAIKEEEARLTAALKECSMDGMAGEGGAVTLHADTVNINVASPSDVQGSAMQGASEIPDTAAVDSEPSVMDADDADEDDLSDIEIVDDEEPETTSADDSDDEEDTEPTKKPEGSFGESVKKGTKPTNNLVKENKDLKTNLNEMEVLVARSLYLNKFLCRDDLSSAQKRKIVEFLDTARTVKEAKDVYLKVKKVLDESATAKKSVASRKNVGSGSAVVTESAKNGNKSVLTEGVDDSDDTAPTTNRWQKLAGISKKA